jgi:class 3 adenylate cyclase
MTAARRLAAILAVDVAGCSRLMGEDEAGTARAVRERREAARSIVASPGGRNPELTVKWMIENTPNLPAVFDGLRKAGLPEE